MAMNHGCNIRSRNAELPMGKSGILVRHRIKLPHIFAALGRGELRQAVVSTKFSSITLTVIPIGLLFSTCIRSKRQTVCVNVAPNASPVGPDALPACIHGQEAHPPSG